MAASDLGWAIPPFQPPPFNRTVSQRRAAVRGRGGFAVISNLLPMGWEIQPFQPPRRRHERAAAIMVGNQGTEARSIRFFPNDWDTHPPQPPYRPKPGAGAIMRGDEGIQARFIRFLPNDWDTHPFQPPHPPQPDGRFGGLIKGDEGIYAPFIRFFPYGWEIAPIQPRHPRPEAAGAFMPSEAGIEAQYVFVPPATFLDAPFTHLRYRGSNLAGLKGSSQFPIFSTWINYGWDIPSFQSPHPRPERAGAIATSEPGIEAQFVPPAPTNWGWNFQPFQPPAISYRTKSGALKTFGSIETPPFAFQPYGWEIPPPLTRDQVFKNPDIGDQGIQFPFIRRINFNWHIPPFQPSHPRPERAAMIMPSESGIEAVFVPTVIIWGWEVQSFQPPASPSTKQKYFGIKGRSTSAIYAPWVNSGWEIPSFQPPHPRPEKAGATMPSEAGIEAQYVPVTIVWGWDIAAPFVRYQRRVNPEIGDQGTQASLINFIPYNWIIPPFQPSHPRPERAGAIMPWEPGIEAQYVFVPPFKWGWDVPAPHLRQKTSTRYFGIEGTSDFAFFDFLPYGWELPPFQPPHPRPERGAPVITNEPGIEAKFVPPPFVTDAWEVQSWQPPHPRPERWSALARGDEGTQFPLIRWFNSGWEIAPFQPPHPRPEKAAAIMPWEAGIEAKYIFVTPPTIAWEISPFQPRHPTPERRAAAIFKGDDGIQSPFMRWFNAGWEIAPFQPSHPRAEKFGAVVRGDEGIQARFIRWFNMGWEIPPYQPPHPRFERAGSIMVGHQGTDAIYVFVPPPILARLDPNYITYPQSRVTVTAGAARLLEVSYPQQRVTLTAIGPRKVRIAIFTLDQSQLDGDDVLG